MRVRVSQSEYVVMKLLYVVRCKYIALTRNIKDNHFTINNEFNFTHTNT